MCTCRNAPPQPKTGGTGDGEGSRQRGGGCSGSGGKGAAKGAELISEALKMLTDSEGRGGDARGTRAQVEGEDDRQGGRGGGKTD